MYPEFSGSRFEPEGIWLAPTLKLLDSPRRQYPDLKSAKWQGRLFRFSEYPIATRHKPLFWIVTAFLSGKAVQAGYGADRSLYKGILVGRCFPLNCQQQPFGGGHAHLGFTRYPRPGYPSPKNWGHPCRLLPAPGWTPFGRVSAFCRTTCWDVMAPAHNFFPLPAHPWWRMGLSPQMANGSLAHPPGRAEKSAVPLLPYQKHPCRLLATILWYPVGLKIQRYPPPAILRPAPGGQGNFPFAG